VRALEEGVELGHGSYDCVGEARVAVTLVIWDVCVVVEKAKVGCDVTCGLGLNMETREGGLFKVGVQGLCGFEEVTSLKVVASKVDLDV